MEEKQVLIVYYSLSQQTYRLVQNLSEGLQSTGASVELFRLRPQTPVVVPIKSNFDLFRIMMSTTVRTRTEIRPVQLQRATYDHIIIAGPTWSYNPSGPVLKFLDTYGTQLLKDTSVSFLISCRSYWLTHYWGLKRMCVKCGGRTQKPTVFRHSTAEPWCTFGLLYWLRGVYEKNLPGWLLKRYSHFGHSEEQFKEAREAGVRLGNSIMEPNS